MKKINIQFILNIIAILTFLIGGITYWIRIEKKLDKIEQNTQDILDLKKADTENGKTWLKQAELNGKIIYFIEHD